MTESQPILSEEDTAVRILSETNALEARVFEERDRDLLGRKISPMREHLLVYKSTLAYLSAQDALLKNYQPDLYSLLFQTFGSVHTHQIKACSLAHEIKEQLHMGSREKGGIVDCRGKNLFSIWQKLGRFHHEPDEIFDTVGVRITVANHLSARNVARAVTSVYPVIDPREFQHSPGKMHSPYADSLDNPKNNGFAQIRMNIDHPELGIAEVQIQTMEDYMRWRKPESYIYAGLSQSFSAKYELLRGDE